MPSRGAPAWPALGLPDGADVGYPVDFWSEITTLLRHLAGVTIVFDPDVQDPKRGVRAKLPLRRRNCGIEGRSMVLLPCAGAGSARDLDNDYHGVGSPPRRIAGLGCDEEVMLNVVPRIDRRQHFSTTRLSPAFATRAVGRVTVSATSQRRRAGAATEESFPCEQRAGGPSLNTVRFYI